MARYRRPVPTPFSPLYKYTLGENIRFCPFSWPCCTDGTVCGHFETEPCDKNRARQERGGVE